MEYNTSQKKLILPEYGRHVHIMVQHAINIEDREQRNLAARSIINVMGTLVPQLRDSHDFKHKLWDHLHIMSEFKLDIDSPYPPPSSTELVEKPSTVPYTQSHIRQKHYGKILVEMIHEASKLEDCTQREALVQLLALQMKKSYTAWNRSELNNEQIIQDLWDISGGKIEIDPEKIHFPDIVVRDMPSHHNPSHGHMSKRKRKMANRKQSS